MGVSTPSRASWERCTWRVSLSKGRVSAIVAAAAWRPGVHHSLSSNTSLSSSGSSSSTATSNGISFAGTLSRPAAALAGRAYAGGASSSGPQPEVMARQPEEQRPATSWEDEIEELEKLVSLLPDSVRSAVEDHPQMVDIVEIVMDLGRRPLARFPSGDVKLSAQPISREDLEFAIAQVSGACTMPSCTHARKMALARAWWCMHAHARGHVAGLPHTFIA